MSFTDAFIIKVVYATDASFNPSSSADNSQLARQVSFIQLYLHLTSFSAKVRDLYQLPVVDGTVQSAQFVSSSGVSKRKRETFDG